MAESPATAAHEPRREQATDARDDEEGGDGHGGGVEWIPDEEGEPRQDQHLEEEIGETNGE